MKPNIAALFKAYGLKFFDKVPAGYPYAGSTRYKRVLPSTGGPTRFLAAVVHPSGWILMDYTEGGNKHERLVHHADEVEDFLLQYQDTAPLSAPSTPTREADNAGGLSENL